MCVCRVYSKRCYGESLCVRPLPQNPDGRAFVECTLNVAMMSLFVCALSATEPLCKRICRVYSKRCYDESLCVRPLCHRTFVKVHFSSLRKLCCDGSPFVGPLPQNLCESAFFQLRKLCCDEAPCVRPLSHTLPSVGGLFEFLSLCIESPVHS